tara:strand:+ start:1312 stop:1485 length:174 start_codon:yes stop_codon:yes gene_type:complete
MKQSNTFYNPLKEKLNEYRCHNITLDEMVSYIYKLNPNIKKKVLSMQNEYTIQKVRK